MDKLENNIQRLVDNPQWTEEDRKWLMQYLESSDGSELKALLFQRLHESQQDQQNAESHDSPQQPPVDPDLSRQMLDTIHQQMGLTGLTSRSPIIPLYIRRIAAAALIGLVLTGAWMALHPSKGLPVTNPREHSQPIVRNDVLPGKDKAILTLADGTTVALDDARNGTLAQQGNTRVFKLNGSLTYNASGTGAAKGTTGAPTGTISYNTIATPRGGQYQVVLPDGSQVWLNAASSLRFPTAFSGKERRVEITGEAYFEIAANASMPFTVAIPSAAGSPEIQVLGTHFNVTAYHDDALLKTTLVQGAVKFVSGKQSTLLNPGQQSQLARDGQLNVSDQVDVSAVMAWKNGLFHFEGADIEMVMKQLSRWYDVDIVYGNQRVGDLFYAEIPRNTRLSDVLKALALTGKVDFKIENKKIVVNN